MELSKNKKRDIYFNSDSFFINSDEENSASKYVKKLVNPIFNKVLSETSKNHMLVGGVGSSKPKVCYYQPHNYRLYIDFSKANFKDLGFINTNLKGLVFIKGKLKGLVSFKIVNKTELSFEFKECKIRIKKNQIEIRNQINLKKWYSIEISELAEAQIIDIIKKKDSECLELLKDFIDIFGGSSNYQILNRYSENKITGEDSINLIPIKEKFYNKVVKKVYNEHNIEFTDPVLASNYIVNRAIENVAPTLAKQIEQLRGEIMGTMAEFSKNIETHLGVLQGINTSFNRFNELLGNMDSLKKNNTNECLTIQKKHLKELQEELNLNGLL